MSHAAQRLRTTPKLAAAAVLVFAAVAGAQTPPDDEGWQTSDKLTLHGSPKKGSWLFLRSHPETGDAALRVVLIIESGKDAQEAETVDLVIDGDRRSVGCRVVGRQNVSVRIDAEPIDVQLATMHATSDCKLEPSLFEEISQATKIEVSIRASAYPLKSRTLNKKLVARLQKLGPG